MTTSRQQILERMEHKTYHPMLLQEWIRALGIPQQRRREFRRLLGEMVLAGEIALIKGDRYGLPLKMNLVPGRLQGHPEGYGFVIPNQSGEKDVYISRRNLLDAMHGDHVVARVESTRPDTRRGGLSNRVLEPGRTAGAGGCEG